MRLLKNKEFRPLLYIGLFISLLTAGVFLLLSGPQAPAQTLNELEAGMNMQDQLNQTGRAGPGMERRGEMGSAVGGGRGEMGSAVGGRRGEGGSAVGGSALGGAARGGFGGFGQQPAQEQGPPLATPTPTPIIYDAIRGQRVYDAVSYRRNGPEEARILDDVQKLEITADEAKNYSDDGETLGDGRANDKFYSRVHPPSKEEFIGPISNFNLNRGIIMLYRAQELDPLAFFNLAALTTERFSKVPKLREYIEKRDNRVYDVSDAGDFAGWAKAFLNDYRVRPEDPKSEFFPLYVPRPPVPPAVAAPPDPWKPPNHPDIVAAIKQSEEGQTGGGAGGEGGGAVSGRSAVAGSGGRRGAAGGAVGGAVGGASRGGMAPLGIGRARSAAQMMQQRGGALGGGMGSAVGGGRPEGAMRGP